MALPNLPIKTGHLFLGLAALMFVITVAVFSGGKKEPVAPKTTVAEVPAQEIVVPLIPIAEGQTLTMNDLTTVKWPSEFLPKGSTFDDPYALVGRVAKQDLFPGEPLLKQKVSGSDTAGGLPAIIPAGMRAVTVAVSEIKGVAGFVKPGDRVDVLSTFEIGDDQRVTRTVLQNVLVLASAQSMIDASKYADLETPEGVLRGEATKRPAAQSDQSDKKPDSPNTDSAKTTKGKDKKKSDKNAAARLVSSVTLALTPKQVETLALTENTGDIRLSLRPESDHQVADLKGVHFDQLLGGGSIGRISKNATKTLPSPPNLPSSPPVPSFTLGTQVEVIEGSQKTLYNFE